MNYSNLTFSNLALDSKNGFKLLKKSILIAGVMMTVGLTTGCSNKNVEPVVVEVIEETREPGIAITSEKISSMGIILNNEGNASDFIEEISNYLNEREIDVIIANGSNRDLSEKIEDANLNYQSATVISLNKDSYKGDNLLITAPYVNRENTNSDILALSMKNAGVTDGIRCGVSNPGTLSGRKSSDVENICNSNADLLEIHLGNNSEKEATAEMIFSSLLNTAAIGQITSSVDAIHTIENGETDSSIKNKYSSDEQVQMIKKNGQNTLLQDGAPYYLPLPEQVNKILVGNMHLSYIKIEDNVKGSSK